MFNGGHKGYRGLSGPIKKSIRGSENKETFIAYLEKSVSPESFPNLCATFGVSNFVDRHIMFESLYEQFIKFAYSQADEVEFMPPSDSSKGKATFFDIDDAVSDVDAKGAELAIQQGCRICLYCQYWKGDRRAAGEHADGVYGKCDLFGECSKSTDGVNCDKYKPDYGHISFYSTYKKLGITK